MLALTGRNLGERQRELNTQVNEAAAKNVDFEQVKATNENSDVDKLYKIDLASKYKNIDYIIEVLKSGDSLYISRALKCVWMFDDEYSNVISVNNLHNHVFPFMSTKMKKKLLSAISTHVRNEDRAAAFYNYCMDIKLQGVAMKFLNFTNDSFKLELLKDKSDCHLFMYGPIAEHLKNFVGNSFTLANAYAAIFHEGGRMHLLRKLSYLYSVSDEKYLDMLETSVVFNSYNNSYLGIRLSRSIMKKHKYRVLRNPALYINILNKNVLIRYSTAKDAEAYLLAALPDTVEDFWYINYCKTYKFILDLLPLGKFEFVKTIFTAKYPGQEFEMNLNFYSLKCYTLMTAQEQETWALKHIASETEILGLGRDYMWYKFVGFERSFEEIKKLLMITPDSTKRADMVNILIESAKNLCHVEKLLKHYYDRHVNEDEDTKENFLDKLLQYFNVYEFDENCWTAINMLFHSLDVYSLRDYPNCNSEYKIIALIYDIINKKDVHEAIKQYIRTEKYYYLLKWNTDKLTKERQEMVFRYLFEFYMDEIKKYENVQYDNDIRHQLRKYIYFVLDLLDQFNKGSHNCPELVNKFVKLDWDEFKYHELHQITNKPPTRGDWIRYLKTDAQLVITHLPLLKSNINSTFTFDNISFLLKKLRVYFSGDIAQELLKFFNEFLSEEGSYYKVAHAAAHGIFQLADEKFKIEFMTKYAPTEPKINHAEINNNLLRIQQAICAHACYSRPPVPLKYMLMYIKGDYVHFCLPVFHSYLANLPLPLCIEFIEAILNTPISIQKHGIRLAFECFNTENLNRLVLQVWKRTKNVSLRMKIFKALFYKTADEHTADAQHKLFATLKTIALTLHEDDDEQVFKLLVSSKVPQHLMPEFIEVAWTVVNRLSPKPTNVNRMLTVIEHIDNQFNLIGQEVARVIVDEFIASVFSTEGKVDTAKLNNETIALIKAKWDLTAKYVTYVQSKEDIDMKLELVKGVFKKCLGPLDSGIYEKKYVLRQLCFNFIMNLEYKSYSHGFECYENVNLIMQFILQTLQDTLTIEEIYILVWDLQLGIVARKVLFNANKKDSDKTSEKFDLKEIAANFANELGNLISEFVKKEIYFTSFLEDIKSKVDDKIQTVIYHCIATIKEEDMLVAISFGLMQFELTEVYLLVLNLIPPVCSPAYEEDYKLIMNRIKSLDDNEIRCNLFKKFVNTDFVVREFMHS